MSRATNRCTSSCRHARSIAIAIGCNLVGVRLTEMAAATGIGTAAAVVARTRGRQRIRESAIDVEAFLAPGRER